MLSKICSPALLYLAFSLTQIIIDTFKQLYNTALVKFIVMIIFTIILNILCEEGLTIISWFIVMLPFVMMTFITTLLLFVFGLNPKSGKLNYTVNYSDEKYDNNERYDDSNNDSYNDSNNDSYNNSNNDSYNNSYNDSYNNSYNDSYGDSYDDSYDDSHHHHYHHSNDNLYN